MNCLSRAYLLLLLLSQASIGLSAPSTTTCSFAQTATECVNLVEACLWCASSYSCLPDDADAARLCVNECSLCSDDAECSQQYDRYKDVNPTAPEFDLFCVNGGVKQWSSNFPESKYPNIRFGGERCLCPDGWLGYDCSVCRDNSTCVNNGDSARNYCNHNWLPTADTPDRSLRCTCDSNLCVNTLDVGPDASTIMVDLDQQSVSVDIRRRIPLPSDQYLSDNSDNQFDATTLFKAKLTACTFKPSVRCKTTCNDVDECFGGNYPWSETDYCHTFTCDESEIDCPENDFYSGICDSSELQNLLKPPFMMSCIEDQSGQLTKRCSFATKVLPHGDLTLLCDTGVCSARTDPVYPEAVEITCLGLEKDTCDTIKYVAMLIVPLSFSYGLILTCFCVNSAKNLSADLSTDKQLEAITPSASHQHYSYLVFKDVSLSLPRRGRVLSNLSGYMGGPQLMAILGPSGSGKTSFMDIVAGRKNFGKVSGKFALDGYFTTRSEQRKLIGYVLQDDVMPATSTVGEYLEFHAMLRIRNSTSFERARRISTIVADMGLESCQASLIGGALKKGISGGEKRRVSIAVELLANKQLILMDEPTSGLDSTASQQVINALKHVVAHGRGVTVSIHQPSSRLFAEFDRVLLLSKQGEIVYMGPRAQLVPFFAANSLKMPAEYNPAEYSLDVVSMQERSVVERLVSSYQASDVFQQEKREVNRVAVLVKDDSDVHLRIESDVDSDEASMVSFAKQFTTLCQRFINSSHRHPVLPMVHIGATLAISGVATLLYFDITNDLGGAINRAGLFFFLLTYLTLAALADLGVWQEERILFIRESAAGCYRPEAYLLAKMLCEVVLLRVLPITLSTFVLTFGIGLQNDPARIARTMVVFLLVSVISAMLFLTVGMSIQSAGVANYSAVIIALFCLLLSGFLLIDFSVVSDSGFDGGDGGKESESLWPLRWLPIALGALSYLRPAFEILMVNELFGLTFNVKLTSSADSSVSAGSFVASGDLVLAQLNLSVGDIALDMVLLVMWLVLYSLLAMFLLRFRVVERR